MTPASNAQAFSAPRRVTIQLSGDVRLARSASTAPSLSSTSHTASSAGCRGPDARSPWGGASRPSDHENLHGGLPRTSAGACGAMERHRHARATGCGVGSRARSFDGSRPEPGTQMRAHSPALVWLRCAAAPYVLAALCAPSSPTHVPPRCHLPPSARVHLTPPRTPASPHASRCPLALHIQPFGRP